MSAAGSGSPAPQSAVRQLLGLGVPALGVLAAEPLYVLVDTAVVGHVGALALAGLALGGVVLSQVSSQLTFLSYGTTARAARLHGAGRRGDAVGEGVQATYLGLLVGVAILVVGQLVAAPVAQALAGNPTVAAQAVSWLRIALFGAPLILVTMAGNGWLRGVQDARRPLRYVLVGNGFSAVLVVVLVRVVGLGLVGSAIANVVAQVLTACLFLRALLHERRVNEVSLRPNPKQIRAQLGLGRDLVLRSLAFQVCFVSAAAVAARTSAAAVGAHQIVLQLWTFLSLVLDSLAIAAQSLIGASLGGGDVTRARALAKRVGWYGLWFGIVTGVVFAALFPVLPHVFTSDSAVLSQIPHAWWFFVGLQPLAGVVFALDGVLLGAGDAAFLRTATLISALVGFLPLVWISLALHWGLVGVWSGLAALIVLRLVAVLLRTASGRWATAGASISR